MTAGDGLGMIQSVLDVDGEDLGLLIGRRGQTLASLQYLLNLALSMKRDGTPKLSTPFRRLCSAYVKYSCFIARVVPT